MRPRQYGKSHQGSAVGSLFRPHLVSSMVAEPASSSFLLFGLSSSGKTARFNLARNGVDDCTSLNPSPEALKNRGRYYEKHASHPLDALQPLSLQGTFHPSSFETYPDLIINVLPRHGKNNGGKGELCLKSENKPKSSQKWEQSGLIRKCYFLSKSCLTIFGQNGPLFIPASGHTAASTKACKYFRQTVFNQLNLKARLHNCRR